MASLSRKDFFKKIGLGIGVAAVTPLNRVFAGHLEDDTLSSEKKQFLTEYQKWLHDFHLFVEKRNQNNLDMDNNKRLMELSSQAESRKPVLESYMKDTHFADYFNKITADITQRIDV
jgi:hypothetical protein